MAYYRPPMLIRPDVRCGFNRDRVEPAANPAMSAVPPPRRMDPGSRQVRRGECCSPRRLERIRPRHFPGVRKARIAGAVDQFARTQRRIKLCERPYLGRGAALRKM